MNLRAQHPPRRGRLSLMAGLTLLALLLLPGLATLRLARASDGRWIIGYLLLISTLTFCMYWSDKRKAERGGWRTPEFTLHLVEFLGGWPAAFLAQRVFR